MDDETALAGTITEEEKAKMSWWWFLLIAVFGAIGVVVYKEYQKRQKKAE